MIELFENLPAEIKKQHKDFLDFIFENYSIPSAAQIILEYVKTCINSDEQDFIDFYFNLKMEQLRNEDSNDFREEPTR